MYAVGGWNILYVSDRSIYFIVCFNSSVSLLIFCLYNLSFANGGIVKSPPVIVLYISPLRFVSICLIYFSAQMLGVYMFIVVMSS